MTTVNIKHIDTLPCRLGRVEESPEKIAEYAELMSEGVTFPPVTVYYDGKRFYLSDGWHRLHAHKKLGWEEIEADLRQGTQRDAQWHALGANNHGLAVTIADKRKKVEYILNDVEWVDRTDREIAKHVAVSHTFVRTMRERLEKPNVRTKKPVAEPSPKPDLGNVSKIEEPQDELADNKADDHLIQALVEENAELTKKLALAALPEEDKEEAAALIDDLRGQIKDLQIELDAVKKSRDTFQSENVQLKRQVAAQQRQIKKLEEQCGGSK